MIRFALPVLILGACAANAALPQKTSNRDDAKIARALEGLTAGAPQDCIDRTRVGEVRGYRDTILYVGGRNKIWRNDPIGSCSGLAQGDLLVVESMSGRICRGDRASTRARLGGMLTSSCALGPFVPYTRAK
ncbi:hypothetical protein P6144_16890 [Sphingomonas sp. HITSZ_GF]|uniref:hypothetical protein n=1 Tax=Sphingomonas sp. HITSZ_GF TaxID=3037247 RepID=UPI00240DA0F5|nr:hypothetical protein [Sphingomonas sp. HITSZ_GF]MDG2535340.1 hypothetical protein [Sphingomonas sp. HITSZ_GF]